MTVSVDSDHDLISIFDNSSRVMCNVFHIRLHLNFMYYLVDVNRLKDLNVQYLHTVIIVL